MDEEENCTSGATRRRDAMRLLLKRCQSLPTYPERTWDCVPCKKFHMRFRMRPWQKIAPVCFQPMRCQIISNVDEHEKTRLKMVRRASCHQGRLSLHDQYGRLSRPTAESPQSVSAPLTPRMVHRRVPSPPHMQNGQSSDSRIEKTHQKSQGRKPPPIIQGFLLCNAGAPVRRPLHLI